MKILPPIFLLCALVGTCEGAGEDQLIRAIWQVESSGRHNPPDGDGGRAIGPLQIWRVYWIDAVEHDRRHGRWGIADGNYDDCRKIQYARRVVLAYWDRYARGKSLEARARIHNGGPTGHTKKSTLPYWRRVQQHLGP